MKSDRGSDPIESAVLPRAMLESAALGVALLCRNGWLAEANPRMQEILGRSAADLATRSWGDLTHPDERARVRMQLAELGAALRGELRLEQRALRPDGSWLWVRLRASPLRGAAEHAGALIVTVEDITAEKLAEEALRHSETRFRALIERLPAAAYTCDREGLITYFNERAVQLWGRTPRLNHPDDRYCGSFRIFGHDGSPISIPDCFMARALREGTSYFGQEVVIERPDGSQVAVLAHAAAIRDESGEIIGAMNVLVDISDRKRAQLMLLGSELRFTQFMQHLHGLAWIKDFEGRYLFMNDAAEHVLGRRPADFLGRTDEEIFPPRAAAQFRENDRKVLATGVACETTEDLEQDDELRHYMVCKFPIPGPDGGSTRVGGIAMDITERVRRRAALEEADRRKDAFLATLAHELRNPLAPIRNALRVVRETGSAPSSLFEMIDRQVGQMVRLVDDLLEISRISHGGIELRREPVEIASVVEAALETSRPAIEAKSHALEVSLPREPLVVDADRLRLAQVLVNLLNNAARYTPEGGHLALSAQRRGDEAVISVRDDGIGIPAEALPTIFEPFTHIQHPPKGTDGGLGIGLALVAQLVKLHGGRVEVHSDASRPGSEFSVILPLSHERAPRAGGSEAGAARSGAARAGAPPSVLVVDDNRDAAESLAMLLRSRGHEVEIARDGAGALAAFARLRPSAALLDIGLPDMDGFEVARRIRSEPGGAEVLLIALTGWSQEETRASCRRAGFDHHLVKPVELETVEALLATAPRAPARRAS